MLREFSKDKTRKPLVTYIVVLIAITITSINVITNSFNNFLPAEEIIKFFLFPFHHGFDFSSSIIHLVFSISFFWYIGRSVEKILGSFHYSMLIITSYLTYVALLFFFDISGYGLTPIIFSMVVYAFASMTEAKDIKPVIVHESYYKRINSICVAYMLTTVLFFSLLPVFYDVKSTTLLKGIFEGNFIHLIEVLLGLITLVFFRRKIRMNWLRFNKRKHFSSKPRKKKRHREPSFSQ